MPLIISTERRTICLVVHGVVTARALMTQSIPLRGAMSAIEMKEWITYPGKW